MLHSNHRDVLHFDFAMRPHPPTSDPIPFRELLGALEKLVSTDEASYFRDNERRVVKVSKLQMVKSTGGTEAVALLLMLGDRDRADPGFINFDTGKNRIIKKHENEGGALSAHVLLSLDPTEFKGYVYSLTLEDVPGLGRTLLEDFFRYILRKICKDEDRRWKKDGGEVQQWPDVEVAAHQSQRLRSALEGGGLQAIELVEYIKADMGFDEAAHVKKKTRRLTINVSREIPKEETMGIIEKVRVYALGENYSEMRLRWKNEAQSKSETAYIPMSRQDVGEALLTRSSEVSLKTILPDCSDDICDELLKKMIEIHFS